MINKRVIRLLFFLIVFTGFVGTSYGQDLFKAKDLSQVRVDKLTDADITKLKSQLISSGMTIDQAEQVALSKGMSSTEFAKLKERINKTTNTTQQQGRLKNVPEKSPTSQKENNSSDTLDVAKYNDKPKTLIDSLIFGSELYTSVAPSFEPNLKLATPMNYILGPDDQISVAVYGLQQYSADLLVSSEGNIYIQDVGQIKVAGLTIEAATEKVKNIMGNGAYPYLKNGGSKLSITLSKIRSIRVTIIGANRPGNFTLSSLSTVFNALFVSGGPSAFGSFREIELIRDNRIFKKIDLYRFLLHGDQTDNIGLKDNDVIRIPPYIKRVELQGQVKRPGIFEVLVGEKFSNILSFASGFTDTAYQRSVKVFKKTGQERAVLDLGAENFDVYQPQTGDVFIASRILNRFQNRVILGGAVFRPDTYELTPGMKVADLIRRADGLKEDAFIGRGQIIRLEEDLTRFILSFDVKKALANDPLANIQLKREDEVLISSVLDLRDTFRVTIQGEIRIPGKYEYVENLTLKDLILQAGGFTDAAFKNIEVARLIKRDSISGNDLRASDVINIEIDNELTLSNRNIVLQPFDVITIRKKAGYRLPESIKVEGQVQYPGPYALKNSNERVSDILRRAGGYTPDAYPEGAYLKRYKTDEEKRKSQEVARKVQKSLKDQDSARNVNLVEDIKRDYDQIPLDLLAIQANPGSTEDLILKVNDELFIPKFDGQVKISGAVLLATQVPYKEDNTFKSYVYAAGGFSAEAWPRKSYIVYANGRAKTIKHFLFFKSYPKVLPGSEIVVPKKSEKKSLSTGEIIGISSALASLAGVVIAILRL